MAARILVAGIGNIFFGDDGFGPEVVAQLRIDDPQVRVVDYGIRGMHLAYDLLDGYQGLVLVDAIPGQGCPGAIQVFEVDGESPDAAIGLDAHEMNPAAMFATLRTLGGHPPRTIVVGCQADVVTDGIGLSDAVRAAVPGAVRAVRDTVAMLSARPGALTGSAD